jgi:hypothetical protein
MIGAIGAPDLNAATGEDFVDAVFRGKRGLQRAPRHQEGVAAEVFAKREAAAPNHVLAEENRPAVRAGAVGMAMGALNRRARLGPAGVARERRQCAQVALGWLRRSRFASDNVARHVSIADSFSRHKSAR